MDEPIKIRTLVYPNTVSCQVTIQQKKLRKQLEVITASILDDPRQLAESIDR